mgnify:CR=1 FL=1
MAKSKTKKSKKKTIGVMTQDRGQMPRPTVKDIIKTKKNDRKEVRDKLKRGEYDV